MRAVVPRLPHRRADGAAATAHHTGLRGLQREQHTALPLPPHHPSAGRRQTAADLGRQPPSRRRLTPPQHRTPVLAAVWVGARRGRPGPLRRWRVAFGGGARGKTNNKPFRASALGPYSTALQSRSPYNPAAAVLALPLPSKQLRCAPHLPSPPCRLRSRSQWLTHLGIGIRCAYWGLAGRPASP